MCDIDLGVPVSRIEYKAWTNFLDYLIADHDAKVSSNDNRLSSYYSRKASQHRFEAIKYFMEMQGNVGRLS